ncbi:hypothetical protein MKX03_005349 [Papaver bracteatum]|nr:hypothetical protein MKX03_005349 [Papaver bracteatum]
MGQRDVICFYLSFSIRNRAPAVEYNSELGVFAEKGDWQAAELLFQYDPQSVSEVAGEYSQTALHIASNAKQWTFVEKLVEIMERKHLELQETKYGYTALHTVVVEGNVEVAKAMVKKNPRLTQIREYNGSLPLKVAADYITDRQEEMVNYLWSATKNEASSFFGAQGATLLCSLIDANFYDIALCVVQKYPNLGNVNSEIGGVTALETMAVRPFAFLNGCKIKCFWQRWIYSGQSFNLSSINS